MPRKKKRKQVFLIGRDHIRFDWCDNRSALIGSQSPLWKAFALQVAVFVAEFVKKRTFTVIVYRLFPSNACLTCVVS
jgi:hypothetical protein